MNEFEQVSRDEFFARMNDMGGGTYTETLSTSTAQEIYFAPVRTKLDDDADKPTIVEK